MTEKIGSALFSIQKLKSRISYKKNVKGIKMTSAKASNVFRKPAAFLTVLLIFATLLWVLPASLCFRELTIDGMEALHWGAEGALGNAKHPPFAGMLVWWFSSCFGHADWSVFLLGSILQGLGWVFLYKLASELFDGERALYAVLLPLFGTALTIEVPAYSVCTPHLALYPMAMYFFYKAVKTDKLYFWFLLGISAALGFLSKYVEALLFIGMFAYLLSSAENRKVFRSFGFYLSIIIAVLIILPHVLWLFSHDFLPFTYTANEMAEDNPYYVDALRGIGLTSIPFLTVLAPAFVISLLGSGTLKCYTLDTEKKDARNFAFCMFVVPLLIVLAIGLTGHTILARWYYQLGMAGGLFAVSLMKDDFLTELNGMIFRVIVILTIAIFGIGQTIHLLTCDNVKGFSDAKVLDEQVKKFWGSQTLSVTGGATEPKVIFGCKYYTPFIQNLLDFRCHASLDFDPSSIENNVELMKTNSILVVSRDPRQENLKYLEEYVGHPIPRTKSVRVVIPHPTIIGQREDDENCIFLSVIPPLYSHKD